MPNGVCASPGSQKQEARSTRTKIRGQPHSPEARKPHNAGMSINIVMAIAVGAATATPPPHSRPMQGYACDWPDCDKTYKKADDLERHERTASLLARETMMRSYSALASSVARNPGMVMTLISLRRLV
jgi:hypothetical protein